MSNLEIVARWLKSVSNGLTYGDFSWTCPYCDRTATITNSNRDYGLVPLEKTNADGKRLSVPVFVVCPNSECREFSFYVFLYAAAKDTAGKHVLRKDEAPLASWQLKPLSEAKVFPEYVPKPIRDDYTEACLIRNLSPKASATLSRRCLQGMIRDFYEVHKGNLKAEIEAIRDKVSMDTWNAIDAVRDVANIGAHMEKDINIIVDVEPEEAAMLIGLVEFLIEDWYINRYERAERLKNVVELAEAKKQARKQPTAPAESTAEAVERNEGDSGSNATN